MTTQIEYISLDLEDFRQFRGRQHVDFARPSADGGCGLTLIVGYGARGKTNLCTAIRTTAPEGRTVHEGDAPQGVIDRLLEPDRLPLTHGLACRSRCG